VALVVLWTILEGGYCSPLGCGAIRVTTDELIRLRSSDLTKFSETKET
jgi:hypothetical protein